MPTVEVSGDVDVEEAQRALSDRLGTGYKVTATSDSSLKVSRNILLRAGVQVRNNGGTTSFRITPGGLTLVMLINLTVTVPKIRQALEQAFSQRALCLAPAMAAGNRGRRADIRPSTFRD